MLDDPTPHQPDNSALGYTRPFVPERRVYTGQPTVSVQIGKLEHLEKVATICSDTKFGAIATIASNRKDPTEPVKDLFARYIDAGGDATHLLIDANRYSGSGRIIGQHQLDTGIVRAQLDAGAALALTDSPYIPAGDTAALNATLQQAVAMRLPVLAALPLGNGWFQDAKHAAALRDAISFHGVPVGVMIEHSGDPFGVARVVRGVLTVLQADAPVHLLRCDISIFGAIAHGAAGGAIGTNTAVRHIFPKKDPDKKTGFYNAGRTASFVPRLLGYHSRDALGDVAQFEDVYQFLVCECVRCNGLGVERIVDEDEAFDHSLHAIDDFARGFLVDAPLQDLCRWWHAACQRAQVSYLEIESKTPSTLKPRDFLAAWTSAHK